MPVGKSLDSNLRKMMSRGLAIPLPRRGLPEGWTNDKRRERVSLPRAWLASVAGAGEALPDTDECACTPRCQEITPSWLVAGRHPFVRGAVKSYFFFARLDTKNVSLQCACGSHNLSPLAQSCFFAPHPFSLLPSSPRSSSQLNSGSSPLPPPSPTDRRGTLNPALMYT